MEDFCAEIDGAKVAQKTNTEKTRETLNFIVSTTRRHPTIEMTWAKTDYAQREENEEP